MEHRGACSADRDSGDGAGVMTALPEPLFQSWFDRENIPMPAKEHWGVGMAFLPQDSDRALEHRLYIEEVVKGENLTVLGWREVPVRPEVLGVQARENQPRIEQVIVTSPDNLSGDEFRSQTLHRSLSDRKKIIRRFLYLFLFLSHNCL